MAPGWMIRGAGSIASRTDVRPTVPGDSSEQPWPAASARGTSRVCVRAPLRAPKGQYCSLRSYYAALP